MTERPILMAPDMVRAILDGKKTETRRVVKQQPNVVHAIHDDASITTNLISRRGCKRIKSPYGQPGDVLWVREAFRVSSAHDDLPMAKVQPGDCVEYAVDQERVLTGKTRPSIFMPRWAARIFLEVLDVRVERLQGISEVGAREEGFNSREEFFIYWDRLARPGERVENDPWPWVVKFKRLGGGMEVRND